MPLARRLQGQVRRRPHNSSANGPQLFGELISTADVDRAGSPPLTLAPKEPPSAIDRAEHELLVSTPREPLEFCCCRGNNFRLVCIELRRSPWRSSRPRSNNRIARGRPRWQALYARLRKQDLSRDCLATMEACVSRSRDTVEPAMLVFMISADGKIRRVLSTPGIEYRECIVIEAKVADLEEAARRKTITQRHSRSRIIATRKARRRQDRDRGWVASRALRAAGKKFEAVNTATD